MTLSLNKLDRLLSSRGFTIKKYFVINNLCVYLEILSFLNADTFLLYIPSKYEINAPRGADTFTLEYLEIDTNGNLPGDFAGEPNEVDVEKIYNEIDIVLDPNDKERQNLIGHLEENYNRPINLRDMKKTDKDDIKEIFRQLRRFKLCVKNIKYKMGITYKNFICCIRRDEGYDCFAINHYHLCNDNKKLTITVDLETLYSKIDTISNDTNTVRDEIYKILDKNQTRHSKLFKNMLEQGSDITTYSEAIYMQKKRYEEYLSQLEDMLVKLTESERKTNGKLNALNGGKKYDPSLKGLHTDIHNANISSKYRTELDRITSLKQEVIKNILNVKIKQENIMLKIDRIFFDNSVMINAIITNMNSLRVLKI